MHVAVEQGDGVALVGEGQAARQQLVEHRAHGVHVGGRGQLGTQGLLGRHVGGRAQHLAGAGAHGLDAAHHLGDAEVGHLERVGPAEEEVVGLDVAMEDALVVGVVQGAARRDHDAAGRGPVTPSVENRRQRVPPDSSSMTSRQSPSSST